MADKWKDWYLDLESQAEGSKKGLVSLFGMSIQSLQGLLATFLLRIGDINLPNAEVYGLRNIEENIKSVLDLMYKGYVDYYNIYSITIYMTGYTNAVNLLQGSANPSSLSPDVMNEIINRDWVGNGLNVGDRIDEQKLDLLSRLTNHLRDGIISGSELPIIINKAVDDYQTALTNANRLFDTEHNYLANQALLKSYADNGVERYQFCAVLDKRTSQICRNKDGHVFLLSEAENGNNIPPLHPHCRSYIVPFKD